MHYSWRDPSHIIREKKCGRKTPYKPSVSRIMLGTTPSGLRKNSWIHTLTFNSTKKNKMVCVYPHFLRRYRYIIATAPMVWPTNAQIYIIIILLRVIISIHARAHVILIKMLMSYKDALTCNFCPFLNNCKLFQKKSLYP